MELTGDCADDLAQPPLDAGVDILVGDGECEVAGFNFGVNLPETPFERRGVFSSDDSLFAKHSSVGNRPADIFAYQAHIERYRRIEGLKAAIGRLGEPPAPRLGCSHLLGHASSWQIAGTGVESPLPIATGEGLE
jgi:hypothetical protein